MVYSQAWDEAIPGGGRQASLGDDDIRALKIAIRERMETFVNDWDSEDPLQLLASALTDVTIVQVGNFSARPNPPASSGLLFYAADAGELYVSVPGSPDPVWELISSAGPQSLFLLGGFAYNADGGDAATRKGTAKVIGRIISMYVSGTTSSIGTFGIVLPDFDPDYNSTKVIAAHGTMFNQGGAAVDMIVTNESTPADPADDGWFFHVFSHAGVSQDSVAFFCHVTLVMEAV